MPTVPSGTVVVPMLRDDPTVSVSAWVSVRDAASVTRTVNVTLPAVVGVPLSTPVLLRLSPGGSVPDDTTQA